jgi:hypothetical protein
MKNIINEEWIQKDTKSKIPKLNRKTVFVPSQKELFFSHFPKNCWLRPTTEP